MAGNASIIKGEINRMQISRLRISKFEKHNPVTRIRHRKSAARGARALKILLLLIRKSCSI